MIEPKVRSADECVQQKYENYSACKELNVVNGIIANNYNPGQPGQAGFTLLSQICLSKQIYRVINIICTVKYRVTIITNDLPASG